MNPFYFGSSDCPLYGVYHPPRSRSVQPIGVVLCYPFGVEYMRAHRAFRQLSMLLAKAGFHVLRFDYSCTGDSGGDGVDASIDQWRRDVGLAIDELKDTAAVDRVHLVGLRLGGSLAALAAAGRNDVERLILWDPVVDGAEYVASLCRLYIGPSSYPEVCDPARLRAEPLGLSGYPLTESLYREFTQLRPETLTPAASSARVTLLASSDQQAWADLHTLLVGADANAEHRVVPSDGSWAEGDEYGSALLPQAIIQAVVNTVGEPVHV